LIAVGARPELDVGAELARLDELAAGSPEPTLDGLIRHLFTDLGFRGNTEHYEDPDNSYLDQVLQRRVGIPISLSVLTMEVGRCAAATAALDRVADEQADEEAGTVRAESRALRARSN